MKPINYLTIVAAVSLLTVSCQEKEDGTNQTTVPEITLSAPEDGAEITADAGTGITFEWNTSEDIGKCVLKLSLSSSLASAEEIEIPSGSPLTVSGNDFVEALIALGIEEGLPTRIYWSVQPAAEMQVNAEVRSMTVTCSFPSITLTSPENLIVIDGNKPAFPYTFSFNPVSSISGYSLEFSLEENITSPVTYEMTGTSWTMTEDAFYALMEDLGITGSESVIVYWTVSATDGTLVQSQTRSFTARRSALKNAVASWTFDDAENILKADIGADMQYAGTVPGSIDGPGDGNGAISVPAGKENYLKAIHGISPNGNTQKELVNEYTIMMDLRVPAVGWNALIHTDFDLDHNAVCRLALSGDDKQNGHSTLTYNGEMMGTQYVIGANTWHRVILTAKCGNFWDVYVDGEYILDGNVADYAQLDSEFALEPEGVLFCTDNNWVPSLQIDFAQITIWDEALDADTIASLGTVPVY